MTVSTPDGVARALLSRVRKTSVWEGRATMAAVRGAASGLRGGRFEGVDEGRSESGGRGTSISLDAMSSFCCWVRFRIGDVGWGTGCNKV